MAGRVGPSEPDAAGPDAAPRVVLTVRLYGRAHQLLVEEFASLARRRRAARAAQLMLVGLLCERASLRAGPGMREVAPPPTPRVASLSDFGLAPEAEAFVTSILRCSGTPEADDDLGGSGPSDRSSADQPS